MLKVLFSHPATIKCSVANWEVDRQTITLFQSIKYRIFENIFSGFDYNIPRDQS